MEMKGYLRKAALAAGMFGLMALPMAVKADALNMNVDLGGDDQAHYNFNGGMEHHHPMIWKAAQQLRNAKHSLWKAHNDFHGHKADAIGAINAALDQLRICEQE